MIIEFAKTTRQACGGRTRGLKVVLHTNEIPGNKSCFKKKQIVTTFLQQLKYQILVD